MTQTRQIESPCTQNSAAGATRAHVSAVPLSDSYGTDTTLKVVLRNTRKVLITRNMRYGKSARPPPGLDGADLPLMSLARVKGRTG
jgi:hypothetical protein